MDTKEALNDRITLIMLLRYYVCQAADRIQDHKNLVNGNNGQWGHDRVKILRAFKREASIWLTAVKIHKHRERFGHGHKLESLDLPALRAIAAHSRGVRIDGGRSIELARNGSVYRTVREATRRLTRLDKHIDEYRETGARTGTIRVIKDWVKAQDQKYEERRTKKEQAQEVQVAK